MTIYLYTGVPGSGKSMHVQNEILWQSVRKAPAVLNFEIRRPPWVRGEEWPVYRFDEVSPEHLIAISRETFKNRCVKEDDILLVIDEAQLFFNSRNWQQKNRDKWIKFFTQHRKYGYKVVIITQFDKMLDKQIRSLVETRVEHRKMASLNWGCRLLSALTFGRLFMAVYSYYGMGLKLGTKFFIRWPWSSWVYDTHKTWEDVGAFAADASDGGTQPLDAAGCSVSATAALPPRLL